jgi:type VI secretion system protein ImpL
MSFLLPILKSKFAQLGAVLIVALLIAVALPRFIGSRWRLWCWLAAILIILGYLLYLLIKKMRAKKNARMLEGFLNQQANDQMLNARPDVQDELAAIKEKLARAMQVLRQSRVARGRRGAEALYVLPWYMIIGPSASGKSTAIRNSGLHFPPVDPDSDDPGRIKGMGGTRNCDWWFSNEGIILDTAGRYTLSANVQEDREEWTSFLQMLRKARPRAPINGLILGISLDELLKMDAEGMEAHARALRARVDELIVKLEILFPIYVVFTKCDLVSGFVEMFGDLSRGDREQVWGYTREYGPAREQLHKEFEREVRSLKDVLERRRIRELSGDLRPAQKRGIYLFPVEFDDACARLSGFIESLFRPNPYQQNPLVRGVYFTSGTQEGTPIARVIASMRHQFSLGGGDFLTAEPVRETKAYFIRDLFQEVILPDEAKVAPTTKAWRRRRFLRGLAIAAQLIAAAALSVALFISYGKNRVANTALGDDTARIAHSTGTTNAFSIDMLDTLDILRDRLQTMEAGTPVMSRWGIYSGDVALEGAREVYFDRFRRLLLVPTAMQLSQSLTSMLQTQMNCEDTSLFDRYYSAFTTYKMLTLPSDSIPHDPGKLLRQVKAIWRPFVPEERQAELDYLAERQVDYYWRHRTGGKLASLQVAPDRNLLAQVGAQFDRCWTPQRLYRTLIDEVNGELGDYRYVDAITSIRVEGGSVGRAFTRDGWEQAVRPRIERISDRINADPALQEAFAVYEEEEIRKQMMGFYADDFVANWRQFISSGKVRPFYDLNDAFAGMVELSADPSPVVKILDKVFDQTEITDSKGKRFEKIEQQFEPIGRFLGRRNVDAGEEPNKAKYTALLAALPAAVQGVQQKLQGEARCAESLTRFNGDINLKSTQIGMFISGPGLAAVAADLLREPLFKSRSAASAGACACLDRVWRTNVLEDFNLKLASSYPFSPQGVDASPGDVEGFFTRTLRAFVDAEIKPAEELGVPLSGSFRQAITTSRSIQEILSRGTEKLRFTLTATGDMPGVRSLHLTYPPEPEWTYVMGQPQRRDYKWPQPGAGTCDLRITSLGDAYFEPKRHQGPWGIFRLFDEATVRSSGDLVWVFKSRDGQSLNAKLTLGGSDARFILDGHFTQFKCPPTVCP